MAESFLISYESNQLESVRIPKTIIKNFGKIGIKPNEWSLFCLISYIESETQKMPTQDELGHMIGMSERQVKQIIADLKKKGLLSVNRTKKATTRYNFTGLLDKAMEIDLSVS